MKKIAIFVEGLTEQLFLRNLLEKTVDLSKISFDCFQLVAKSECPVPYCYRNSNSEFHFIIINVQGDEGVLSTIKEREKSLIEKGNIDQIYGLRDMYSSEYDRLSPGIISATLIDKIIANQNSIIDAMHYASRIKLHFAIMEIEAWFLGFSNTLERVNSSLAEDHISRLLGVDFGAIDPQSQFYKPSITLKRIFESCAGTYSKSRSEIESICSVIQLDDIITLFNSEKCSCFQVFYKDVFRDVENCLFM